MKRLINSRQGISGIIIVGVIALVFSIGVTAYILLVPSDKVSIPFISKWQKSTKPLTGFGELEVVPTAVPLSSSDKLSDIDAELTSTTIYDFESDLSEIDGLINEL